MNLHEYQAKQLFQSYDIATPKGRIVHSVEEVKDVAAQLGGDRWVVKAQVHAGGRGKGGGVKIAASVSELSVYTSDLIGSRLHTPQTGEAGLPVNAVLIEELTQIEKEVYLGLLIDRSQQKIVFVASSMGGMNIEEVASESPEKICSIFIDPVVGLMPYQCRTVAFELGLSGSLIAELTLIMTNLYKMFLHNDMSLVEINPLVISKDNTLLALDAKVNIDDNALYRQKSLAAQNDASQEDPREYEARQFELNYIALSGNIGCMVNGAGLAMATMDLIKIHGGQPANFLDVGGGITPERVVEAFKLVLSDENVKAILVNIFGGIVRCDLIADGIIKAAREAGLSVPVVVRLEGTNVEAGRKLLDESGLSLETADGLSDAAIKVIKAAGR